MNFPITKEEGSYASLRYEVEGNDAHFVGISSLPFLGVVVRTLPLLWFMINICLGSWYNLPCAQVQDIHKMQGWTWLPPCPRSLILGMLPPEGFTLHFWTWKPSPKFRNLEWESGREREREGEIDWLTWDLPLAWCYHSGGDSIPNQPEQLDLQAMMYQVAASHMLPESQYTMQEKW